MGMIWVGYRRDEAEGRAILDDPDRVEELLESDDDVTSVDLDKAWHGLHWLLTGSPEPTSDLVSQAVLGGEPLGEDLGHGPARLLAVTVVATLAAALRDTDPAVLRARMDPAALERDGVYPRVWDEEGVVEEYLLPAYERLRDFYADAAREEQAVIQVIC